MAKVQAELDDVIGSENPRFITISDRPNLPYMNATINVTTDFLISYANTNKKFKYISSTFISYIPEFLKYIWFGHAQVHSLCFTLWNTLKIHNSRTLSSFSSFLFFKNSTSSKLSMRQVHPKFGDQFFGLFLNVFIKLYLSTCCKPGVAPMRHELVALYNFTI